MISPKLVTAIFLLTPVTSTFAQGQSEITPHPVAGQTGKSVYSLLIGLNPQLPRRMK